MINGIARVGVVLVVSAFVGACSILVDTSGLAGGAADQAPNDGSAEGARLDGSALPDGATMSTSGGGDRDAMTGKDDAASDTDSGGSCQPLNAPCGMKTCCGALACGDARKCLTCLPTFDDCTSNAQCCSNNCNSVTTICM